MKAIHLPALIVTVFLISWIGTLPGLLLYYGIEIPAGLKALDLLMILGPILGAVIFIARTNGKQGLKEFFRRLVFIRAGPLVLIVAIVAPVLICYIAAPTEVRLADAGWPDRFTAGHIISNGLMVFAMYLFINTEELVWRGIVFDRLYERHRFGQAFPIFPVFIAGNLLPVRVFAVLLVILAVLLLWQRRANADTPAA